MRWLYSIFTRTFLNNYDVEKKKKAPVQQSSQHQNESKRIKDNNVETIAILSNFD